MRFTKMEGCGNDYVYINGALEKVALEDKPELVRRLSDRHFGIGSDGVIFINPVEDGSADFKTQLMIQATAYINKLEPPYFMEAVHRCRNCLFVRFSGEENQLKYAYDKLNLIAFEEDIPLTGTSYTIFTSKDADTFSADVFMEKKCSPMLPPL